jgi:hypothetical protein
MIKHDNELFPDVCESCARKYRCIYPDLYYEECICAECLIKTTCSLICLERAKKISRLARYGGQ